MAHAFNVNTLTLEQKTLNKKKIQANKMKKNTCYCTNIIEIQRSRRFNAVPSHVPPNWLQT